MQPLRSNWDGAANAPIKDHKLRHNVSTLECSGSNIAALDGVDSRAFIDGGIATSRPHFLEVTRGHGRDPKGDLISTHWYFDWENGDE